MAPNTNYVLAEYVWVDGDGGYRSKTKVIHGKKSISSVSELPNWNYDGSSTKQAPGEDSEVIIKPQAIFHDPFRGGNHILVLTDTYKPADMSPLPTNTRAPAVDIFTGTESEVPWFGIEQEYTLFKDGAPLGWPTYSQAATGFGPTHTFGYPGPQGPYYCAAGADVAFGRDMIEEHLKMICEAGINCSGINGEVMPGQWEYQVGPCVGIDAGDQLVMSRYILNRVGEKYGITVSYDPKPVPGDWNGAGCHTNFSTKKMREEKTAFEEIIKPMMKKLESKHAEHIAAYGEGNDKRLTGAHETASIENFSWGVANRGCSIRVGSETATKGYGYFEDRRPASNMDPYVVTSMIYNTCVVE